MYNIWAMITKWAFIEQLSVSRQQISLNWMLLVLLLEKVFVAETSSLNWSVVCYIEWRNWSPLCDHPPHSNESVCHLWAWFVNVYSAADEWMICMCLQIQRELERERSLRSDVEIKLDVMTTQRSESPVLHPASALGLTCPQSCN